MSSTPIWSYSQNYDGQDDWKLHWRGLNQPWRREPEINGERQKFLAKCLTSYPSTSLNGLPFKDITLTRADVEWLIALQKKEEAVNQNNRELNDLKDSCLHFCFADLRDADLRGLPLEKADFYKAHLEGTDLSGAVLEGANFRGAYLQNAMLRKSSLKEANFVEAHLEEADLYMAHLEKAIFFDETLKPLYVKSPELVSLHHLAHLEKADLSDAHLEEADLMGAHLEEASLSGAHLEKSILRGAHLEKCDLQWAHLEEAILIEAHLDGADLRGAFFNSATSLYSARFGDEHIGFARVEGLRWGDVCLSDIDWTHVKFLGDEHALKQKRLNSFGREGLINLESYRAAVRAYRQLAVALQNQGLNEEAAYFAYRGLQLQRIVLKKQGNWGKYLFSLFLDGLSGYGYRLERSLIAYLLVIFSFTGLYLLNAHFVSPQLRWDEALVLSFSSFHGRGFFSQNITLGDTYARLAAAEAVVCLLFEVNLIATFTQRFFGK